MSKTTPPFPITHENVERVMLNFLTGMRLTAKVIGDISEVENEYRFWAECEDEAMYKKTFLIVPKVALMTIEMAYNADQNKNYVKPSAPANVHGYPYNSGPVN